jgi:hypothetical protein
VDALSIDQSNMQERMHQVRIMSSIFRGAEEVLTWLGSTTDAVDTLIGWWENKFGTRDKRNARHDRIPGLQDICGRSYWSRLWVVQELKSAKRITLICGSHTLDWEKFVALLYEAALSITDYSATSRTYDLEVTDITGRTAGLYGKLGPATKMIDLCNGTMPTSLWVLLQVTSHLNCYEPRDKVYTLLSMAKTGSEGIDADYELPLPRLMHRVLRNLYAVDRPQSTNEVDIHCARLKAILGLQPDYPWTANDYLAAEKLAPAVIVAI